MGETLRGSRADPQTTGVLQEEEGRGRRPGGGQPEPGAAAVGPEGAEDGWGSPGRPWAVEDVTSAAGAAEGVPGGAAGAAEGVPVSGGVPGTPLGSCS